MLINIFYVLLLVRIFPSTLGDLRIQNFQRHVSQAEQEEFSDNILRLRISYIYEINKDTKLTSSDVRKKVESAIEEVSGAMKAEQYMSNDHTILIYIESIRPFHNSGKPLAHYNAAELSRFLNNDAHFGKLSKRTDNTQIIALGDHFETEYPEEDIGWAFDSHDTLQLPDEDVWKENDFYNPTEKIKTKPKKKITFKRKNSKQDTPVAVTTFKDICSKKSRGIVIDHEGSTLNIAKLLARNFACTAGIYDKRVCLRGFREYDIKSFKCDVHWITAFPKLCFIHSMLQNNKEKRWTRTNHTCTTNRLIRHRKAATQKSSLFMEDDSSVTDIDEEDAEEDDESGAPKIVFVLLAVSGAFLFLAVLVGICLWWINRRNKTKKLTKDRVSVNYKYDPMKRTDRQSIITDPTVTNDLE